MNILLLRGFNSYFNRIVKKYSTVDDYKANSSSYLELSNMNFNTNDGVNTELIIGSSTQLENNKPLAWEDIGSPDYLICIDPADSSIKYRWFVLECVRTRNGQYRISLKRDTVADNLEDILNSTCFIEKGYVNKEDSAIYNKEDMTFNQIKDNEYLLMDETQTPWIVGYVAKDRSQNGAVSDVEFKDAPITNVEATASKVSEEYNTFDEFWNAHKDIMGEFGVLNYAEYSVQLDVCYGNLFSTYDVGITCTIDNNGRITWQESGFNNNSYLHGLTAGTQEPNDRWVWKNWTYDGRQSISESLLGTLKPYLPQLLQFIANRENISIVSQDSDKIKKLVSYTKAGPVIKVGNKYYKVIDEFNEFGNASTLVDNPTVNGDMSNLMFEHLNKNPKGAIGHDVISGTVGPETFKFSVSYNKHKLGFMQIYETCTAHTPTAAPLLQDAPYYMFAIPYSDDLTLFSGNQIHCARTKKSVAIAAAQAIALKAGAGAVYDVQILPYCPVRECIKTTYKKDGTYVLSSGGTYKNKYVIVPKPGTGFQIIKKLILNREYYLKKENNVNVILTSTSIIKVMYDNLFNSSTTVYEVKKLEINTTTGIKLYTNKEDETPVLTIDYNTYVAGDKVLVVYLTDTYTANVDDYIDQFADITINRGDNFYTTIDIGKVVSTDITAELDGSSQVVNTILWANTSKFTFDIYLANHLLLQSDDAGTGTVYKVHEINQDVIDNLSFGFNAMSVKVKSQTELLRLVSPNYSSFFDINVQYNKGINYFNIDCFYKPYQPYIHVNPDFNGLYGKDFDDVRGLICGGDFSIALTNDAWSTYQLNNKNYQAIFDRNMQSLELNNNIQKINDVASALAGGFQGATGGAMTGAVATASPWGAAIGAVAGTIASAVGGSADVQNNEILRNEAISNQRDQFGYQLKNIQALPQGLMKTSSLNNNNKLYPFLEHYTSTAEEKHALENKITYNGMTIMRIGTPSEFSQEDGMTYVKGRLIRTTIQDDNHLISDINAELNQGVYL